MTEQQINAGINTVILRRYGQFMQAMPACKELRSALQTIVHVPGQSGNSVTINRATEALHRETMDLDEMVIEYFAGLHPAALRVLESAGCRIEARFKMASPLTAPDVSRIGQLPRLDSALLQFVQKLERGLIRYMPAQVDVAWLIAQIALAWPTLTIAVATSRIAEARQLRGRLLQYIPGVVAVTSRDRVADEQVGHLAIATFNGLGHPDIEIEKRDILIVLNAVEASRPEPLSRLGHASRARTFGLLPLGHHLARYDLDSVVILFGFDEVTILAHGQMSRTVEIVKCRHIGGMQLPEKLSLLEVKRSGLWRNPVRNRRLSALAEGIRSGNLYDVRDICPIVAEVESARAQCRVVIVVENVEHATAISQFLPAWTVVTGQRLPSEFEIVNALGIIATWTGMKQMQRGGVDVLIRADGGLGLLPLPYLTWADDRNGIDCPLLPSSEEHPLLFVDFDDRHHPILRRWSRQRWVAYADQGWFAPGVDPAQARIDRFLDTRPKPTAES